MGGAVGTCTLYIGENCHGTRLILAAQVLHVVYKITHQLGDIGQMSVQA